MLVAAVLAGGGIVVGAAIADEADDDDDRNSAISTSDDDGADDDGIDDDGADDDGIDDDSIAAGLPADIGSDSAAALSEIIAAASESADGDAVGIEANGDGSWDVQFETSTGAETGVRVASDGTAEVVSTDDARTDDAAPQGVLDVDTVDAMVAAALAEVDGKVVDLEIDDDPALPFDISVLQADGRTVDVELDADMKVLH